MDVDRQVVCGKAWNSSQLHWPSGLCPSLRVKSPVPRSGGVGPNDSTGKSSDQILARRQARALRAGFAAVKAARDRRFAHGAKLMAHRRLNAGSSVARLYGNDNTATAAVFRDGAKAAHKRGFDRRSRNRLIAAAYEQSRPRATMPEFIIDFGSAGVPAEPDGRLHGPAFQRNHAAIWSAMEDFLRDASGDVLELGSGTGQHIADFARRTPQLTWWPSDIIPAHLASIEAWRRDAKLPNLRAPQRIDLDQFRLALSAGGGQPCRHALHQRAAHRPLARCRKPCSPAPGVNCAMAARCSSMARSNATAPIPRRTMRLSMPVCAPRIRNGACAT